MILVYTGEGKGKTSACVGQAIRALGQGLTVAFAQFIKRDRQAGEQKILAQLLADKFLANGQGFFLNESERWLHRQKALELLNWAKNLSVDMLILDEAIYALNYGLISHDDLKPFMNRYADIHSHLVLSGRDAPQWIREQADMVTEMLKIRHQLDNGIKALPGIEY